MEGFLKQSTAVNITILMIDSSDHLTGKTGLAAGLTIYATKAAGTPAAITPTVTELDATNVKGVYKLALDTNHTNTLGELQLHITATGADPTDIKWQVTTFDLATALAQTGDAYAVVNNGSYGNAQLVRSTTPANTLDVSATGEVGLDFNNIKDASGAHTLTNITVPTVTDVTTKTGFSLSGTQTFNVTGNITGNLSGSVGSLTTWDKTGYAIGTGGIADTSFAVNAISAAALAADATTEITAGIRIKKNTALANFMFLMVDSTDHVTPKTGLTITATMSIDGAAFASCANSATEVANGMYKINLAATDLNGDVITLRFTGTAADARLITIVTTT